MPIIKKGAKDRAKEVAWKEVKSIPKKVVGRVKDYAEKRYNTGKAIFSDTRYIIRGTPTKKKNSR